ncbi:AATF family protein [Aspergillus fischeri NRRL 181]|uniref:Protein BFR2 n=1 Tax=Neosartorya fischeri (strain ATCC 1020 / DSM 3700 / CBS 544.65 / FGSC A1164 / JCM 1740 / NRRL 181 / WB 181) TaxID=331117 RepID=A1DN34_NEOFI|nr:transcription factor AATF/Che-1, putative [Aspergillus fischeri NRRL 181]EAW16205.1 transcription factor AATF/Che-1, putative [Aspergillus fischeri NRRL 181]
MAPKTLAERLAELEDPTPKDFDPEDLERAGPDSDDEGAEAADPNAGREHYQAVGKARLRKQDPINLGKQYAGSKISRDALEAESDDDPFRARSSDEEEDSEDAEEEDSELGSDEDEDASEESEEERPRKSKSSAKDGKRQTRELEVSSDEEDGEGMDTDGSEEIEGSADDSEDGFDEDDMGGEFSSDDDDDDEDEDEDEDEESDNRKVRSKETSKSDDREELRRLMSSDQKKIAATISQAAKADAAKGRAVKQQRATFDALLNARIKLQKGLTAINQLSITAKGSEETPNIDGEAIKSAESAALALWSTLEDLRLALADAQTQDESKKRKRPSAVSVATSTDSLWKRMTDLESDAVAHRRAVLDKWSLKVRGSSAALPNARGKLLGASASSQQTITAVIDAQVASETGDRAAKRRRNSSDEGPEPVYDDTIFYQSLLRDLVEQRMSSSDAITNGIDTLHLQLPSRQGIHPITGMRKDKVKRDVDTRASKGRKMRFDVHEKLQNFMAPEDRGSWTTTAREEFFASLLGKTASGLLREGDDEDASAAEESDEDREEVGLRLFRS